MYWSNPGLSFVTIANSTSISDMFFTVSIE
jgi:hypothetical protein